LVSGIPFKESDQDTYADLMRMEDKEIKFWDKVNKVPNNMEVEEWEEIRADYHERMRIAKLEGIQHEKDTLDDIFKHLEIKELNAIKTTGDLQQDVFIICDISNEGDGMLISRKWNEPLYHVNDIFKYEKNAIERDKYYQMTNNMSDDRYEQWLDYMAECSVMTGKTYDMFATIDEEGLTEYETEVVIEAIDIITEKVIKKAESIIIEKAVEIKKKRTYSESEDDEDDDIEEDENGNLIRNDENLNLDDEYDDTFGEMPDDYVSELPSVNVIDKEPVLETKKEEPEDEWGF
jgi:DNA-binding Lrp family transcriptional regulator